MSAFNDLSKRLHEAFNVIYGIIHQGNFRKKKELSIKNIRCRIHFFSKPKGLYASNATENGTQQKLFLE